MGVQSGLGRPFRDVHQLAVSCLWHHWVFLSEHEISFGRPDRCDPRRLLASSMSSLSKPQGDLQGEANSALSDGTHRPEGGIHRATGAACGMYEVPNGSPSESAVRR